MRIKLIYKLLKLPGIILLLASWVGSLYAVYYRIENITYIVPVILGAIILLYAIGAGLEWLGNRKGG
jgi:hypothetical protein